MLRLLPFLLLLLLLIGFQAGFDHFSHLVGQLPYRAEVEEAQVDHENPANHRLEHLVLGRVGADHSVLLLQDQQDQ